jgi:hypothetical protein
MKNFTQKSMFIFSIFFSLFSAYAQAPQKMSYQAVIRNASNALVTTAPVGMRISILQTTATGTAVYIETQTTTTNTNGLASLQIGGGTAVTGTFSAINWANGPYFIKTETDPTGGTSYSISGTSQLMSVPYALSSGDNKWTANGTDISNNNLGNVGIGIDTPDPNAYGFSNLNKILEISNNGVPNSPSQLVLSSEVSGIGNIGGVLFVNKNTTVSEKRMAGMVATYNDAILDYDSDGIYELGTSLGFFTNKDGIMSQKMKIKINGDVGIGTTTPFAKLDVAGKTRTTDLQVTTNAGTGKVLTSDASGNATWQTANTGWGLNGNAGTNPATNYIGTNDAQNFSIKTNGQERALFKNGGNIELGTTNSTSAGSIAIGISNTASGNNSISIGQNSFSIGNNSLSFSIFSKASGNYSTAFGYGNETKSFGSTVTGLFNDKSDNPNPNTPASNDRIFQVGNGTSILDADRNNAITVLRNGNTGIGVLAPTTKLEVNGFTKLGTDAPAIKVKKLTGTTAATQNGLISIPHGLTTSKILSVTVMVEYTTDAYVPSSYSRSGFECDYYIFGDNIYIWNSATNSNSILSKPFKVLITHEE